MNQMLLQNGIEQDLAHHLMQLAENSDAGFYILTFKAEQPVCEYANPAWQRWLRPSGEPAQEASCNWLQHFHPDDRVRMQQLYLKVFLTGCSERTEYRLCLPNTTVWITDAVCPLVDDAGQPVAVGGCARDITQVKAAHDAMQRTQLLQSLGGLMAGIAHEMNSPLQFIGDNLRFLSEASDVLSRQLKLLYDGLEQVRLHPDRTVVQSVLTQAQCFRDESRCAFMEQEVPAAIRQSLEGMERLMRLVSAMRDVSHLEDRRQAPADINRAIECALTLLHNELKHICDIRRELSAPLPLITCSIDEINRVILNLLINAGHSIAEKIEKGCFSKGLIRVGSRLLADGIQIYVEDNGLGIEPDVQPHIFERFFTTKRNHPKRKGTGQGLALAYEAVVEHHHGALTFRTTPGEGTVFYVFLPFKPDMPQGIELCPSR